MLELLNVGRVAFGHICYSVHVGQGVFLLCRLAGAFFKTLNMKGERLSLIDENTRT